jgi:excisionase family DNA binding protein
MNLLTTSQAAEILGMKPVGVRRLIERGVLPTTKTGRDHLIKPADIERAKSRRGAGRPANTNSRRQPK